MLFRSLDEKFIEDRLAKKCEPNPQALSDFSDSLQAVLAKHNVQPKNSEEWALAINALEIASPYFFVLTELNEEIKKQSKQRQTTVENQVKDWLSKNPQWLQEQITKLQPEKK